MVPEDEAQVQLLQYLCMIENLDNLLVIVVISGSLVYNGL